MDSRRLIVTDVDGTLTGNDEALRAFGAWLEPRRDRFLLAYATGRSRASLDEVIRDTAAPQADAVISSVGTEIHLRDGRPLPGWDERFEDWDAERVHRALAGVRWLQIQGPEAQTRLKASYDAAGLGTHHLEAVRRRLAAASIDANLVYSADLHLDVIPADAGKGIAALELARAWGIPRDAVLAFGDSGNDVGLYREGFRGTIVGNALPELQAVVGAAAYRSALAHAAGIMDGIRHWSPA